MPSAPKNIKSANAVNKSANADSQAAHEFSQRLQSAVFENGWKQADLARESGVPAGRISEYWKGQKQPSANYLFAMAEALSVSAEWLALGVERKSPNHLISADDAEWVEIGEHSILEIDENGKMEPFATTMVRKDWLYSTLGESSGLWITRLLTPYDPLQLNKGTIIICKDVRPGERMLNGVYYLFRINEGIVMAPFALRDPGGDEITVTPRDIGHEEDQYQPVARIVGQLARPL